MPRRSSTVVCVVIPAILRQFTDGQETVKITADSDIMVSVSSCMDALIDKYPELRKKLCDKSGNVARFVHLFVNGKRVSSDDILTNGDELLILIAVSGG